MFLSKDELRELTGRQMPSAQVRALRAMGIEHKVRPDGSVAVLRAHVEQVMGVAQDGRISGPAEPNWSAVA